MITLRSKSLQNPSTTSDPAFRFKPSDTKLSRLQLKLKSRKQKKQKQERGAKI
jgi:hypothetical protein